MQKLIGKLSHKLGQVKLAKFIQKKLFSKKFFTNLEKKEDFNFYLPYENKKTGVSAFIRMKNEEQKIFYCLKSIINVFDEIIVIDNQSEDDSLQIVRDFQDKYDYQNKLKILTYPFKLSLFGSGYDSTPENSIYSFTYYTNFTLSNCSFKFACKWDADMVLKKDILSQFKEFLDKISNQKNKVWKIAGQTVYKNLDSQFFLAPDQIYAEQRIFPVSYLNRYKTGELFEEFKSALPRDKFAEIVFFELKFASENEFNHWSTNDFSNRNRKRKEWETVQLVKSGDTSSLIALPSYFLRD